MPNNQTEKEKPSPERRFNNALHEHGYNLVDRNLVEGLRRYVVDRIAPGAFLRAVLANAWDDAILHAHPAHNVEALKAFTRFLLDAVPAEARGSAAAVDAWIGGGEGDADDDHS